MPGSARSDGVARPIAIIGAPSSIGIKPYTDGGQRWLDLAPGVLRELGVVAAVGAEDRGDVVPPPYVDFDRRPGRVRNEAGVAAYSLVLADAVRAALDEGRFPLVLGGDCSIVLGALLGAKRHGADAGPVGLAYVDAHSDFATPEESLTGSAASMCLALAVGRGDSPLARLADAPLVRAGDVAVVGRRDATEPAGPRALAAAGILDLADDARVRTSPAAVAATVLECVARSDLTGFWIHVDADVLDPDVVPAVDSPEPGGPDTEQLAALLEPLVAHPRALGMQLTIYDPRLDPDRACGARLVALLERALAPRTVETAR